MKKFLNCIDAYLNTFSRICLFTLTLFLAAMMAFAVFMRYALDQAIPAIEELSILIGLWLYFIAMIVVTRERGHLTGGILELLNLNKQTRMYIKAFNDLLGFVVVSFFSFYAFKYLFFVMKINRVSTNLNWPTAIWVAAAVAGFSFMAIYKLRDLFIHKNSYTTYDNKSPHPKDAVLEDSPS